MILHNICLLVASVWIAMLVYSFQESWLQYNDSYQHGAIKDFQILVSKERSFSWSLSDSFPLYMKWWGGLFMFTLPSLWKLNGCQWNKMARVWGTSWVKCLLLSSRAVFRTTSRKLLYNFVIVLKLPPSRRAGARPRCRFHFEC